MDDESMYLSALTLWHDKVNCNSGSVPPLPDEKNALSQKFSLCLLLASYTVL